MILFPKYGKFHNGRTTCTLIASSVLFQEPLLFVRVSATRQSADGGRFISVAAVASIKVVEGRKLINSAS
jgi:hypothetical protein